MKKLTQQSWISTVDVYAVLQFQTHLPFTCFLRQTLRSKVLQIAASILILFAASLAQASIPPHYKLSGQGEIRYLGLIRVYQASLYTPPGATKDMLLAGESSRCLKLVYDVDLSIENFIEAAEKILAKQHDEATLSSVKSQLDLLNNSFRDVNENDSYILCYDGVSKHTELILNGTKLVTIPSADFAAVYFGIWLGEINPIDKDLRNQLLKGL